MLKTQNPLMLADCTTQQKQSELLSKVSFLLCCQAKNAGTNQVN